MTISQCTFDGNKAIAFAYFSRVDLQLINRHKEVANALLYRHSFKNICECFHSLRYLIFNVTIVNIANMIPTIQKRDTILLSCIPSF